MGFEKKLIKFIGVFSVILFSLFALTQKTEATTTWNFGQQATDSYSGCRYISGSSPFTGGVGGYFIDGYTTAKCNNVNGCSINSFNWTSDGPWAEPISTTNPSRVDCCNSSQCSGDMICQGGDCQGCPSGQVIHYGPSGKYCSSVCNADVPCATALYMGTYCRKIGGAWAWRNPGFPSCTESNFCQTYECCSSSSCASVNNSNLGYCGIYSNGYLGWVDSGSSICPYSISINRDKYNYQLYYECLGNTFGDANNCDTGDLKPTITALASNTYPYQVAKLLKQQRVQSPKNLYEIYLYGNANFSGPSNSGSSSYYDFNYTRAGTPYIIINKENCCYPDPLSSVCIGDTLDGYYKDIYSVGLLSTSEGFSVNCDPVCKYPGCSGGPSALSLSISIIPTTVTLGKSATLTYTVSGATYCQAYAYDADGKVNGGTWDWGGTVTSYNGTYSKTITPPVTGYITYYIQCSNSTSTITKGASINVLASPNSAPTASIISPTTDQTVSLGDVVAFTGGGSDPEGPIASYIWRSESCIGNILKTSTSSTDRTFNFTAEPLGSYKICLVVTDSAGASSYPTNGCPCRTVTATSSPPPICLQCNETNQSKVCAGRTFESCDGPCQGTKKCDSSWQEVLP